MTTHMHAGAVYAHATPVCGGETGLVVDEVERTSCAACLKLLATCKAEGHVDEAARVGQDVRWWRCARCLRLERRDEEPSLIVTAP